MDKDEINKIFNDNLNPEVLHNRARDASLELRKLIITLATAILGFSFILIDNEKSELSDISKCFLFISLIFMTLTILFGLLNIYTDGKRNYYRAKWLQVKEDVTVKNNLYNTYEKWKFYLNLVKNSSRITFFFGIISLVIALYDRVI